MRVQRVNYRVLVSSSSSGEKKGGAEGGAHRPEEPLNAECGSGCIQAVER